MKAWQIKNPADEEIIECIGCSDECEICPNFNRCVSVMMKQPDDELYEDLHLEQCEQM